jgi:hypothetical protein
MRRYIVDLETDLALDRKLEESRQDSLARAHVNNGERECDECSGWVDEDDLASYQGQHLCPACYRGYVLDDLKTMADDIQIAFSNVVWEAAKALMAAMEKET